MTIKHFFSETAEAGSLAETLAKETLAASHPELRIGRVKTVADELGRFVVCIQFGAIATPSLCFYAVDKQTRVVTVIDDDALYRPKR